MKQVTIENPVINSPFREPTRHCQFDDGGITDEINALGVTPFAFLLLQLWAKLKTNW